MTGRSAFRLIVIIALTLTFAAFQYSGTFPSHGFVPVATAGCLGPCCVGQCLPSRWVPSGPSADKLRITVFTDETAEFNALLALPPQLDLTDWPLSKSFIPTFTADTRFFVTAPSPEFGMFDIDFNHANTFFGIIPDNHGTNPAGQAFRAAVAHLIDKPTFISNIVGLAGALDNAMPPGQGVLHTGLPFNPQNPSGAACTVTTTTACAVGTATGTYTISYQLSSGATGSYTLSGVCGWEKIATPSCSSAYRDQAGFSDSNGMALGPAEGGPSADFCTAADYLIAAGLASAKQANCTIGAANWKGTASVNFQVRVDSAPRLALGDAIVGRLCELIGLATCPVNDNHITIQQAVPTIFTTGTTSLSWHVYTAGWSLTPQFDQLFALYNSRFASTECGGKRATFGQDYIYYCDPNFDHFSSMLEFNDTLSGAIASANVAMDIFGKTVATIPMWSANHQFAYANNWLNVNDAVGFGPPNFFSLLNMWSSAPAMLDANGNSVLRWGFKQGTSSLNPFLFDTLFEARVVGLVYDRLFQSNPYNPSNDIFGWVANQYQIIRPQAGDPAGTMQDIQIALRPDVFFHDGVRLTAQDVKFSILGAQQVGGVTAAPVAGVLDVTILGSNLFRINLGALSPFALANLGSVMIVPQHVWASDTTSSCMTKGSAQCTVNPTFLSLSGSASDPVVNHRFIGSGPWMCVDLATGQIGGGCTTPSGGTAGSGTQFTGPGDTILLQRYAASAFLNGSPTPTGGGLDGNAYFRTSAKWLQWQWADIFGHGTVDIVDFASAKACTNLLASTADCGHWDTPGATITCTPAAGSCKPSSTASFGGNNDGIVNSVEVAQAASWVGVSWTFGVGYTINHSTGATSSPIGAQTIPQTIYEGGVTYVAETTP